MFQHRINGKKPSDAFLDHFKSKIWHLPPRPTWETFKLGGDVYAAVDGNISPSTADVSSEKHSSPGDEKATLLTPSFFDEAVSDFENSTLSPFELFSPQIAGDYSFEDLNAGDQVGNPDPNSCFSLPTVSSDSGSVFFSDQCGFSPDYVESPSSTDPFCSNQSGSRGIKRARETISDGVDRHDQVPASSHGSKRSRYLTTLNTSIACTHDRDEEVTYLDRDQPYLISIVDCAPSSERISPAKYRTSIQVSFENVEQKRHSAYYWNLWQSSHARKDATTDSRPLKGLDFAASSALFTGIDQNINFQLEDTAVDRFTFTWMTMSDEHPQCQFAVSFHFVSTDFNQAKGVKGCPLRLSALTREVTFASMEEPRNDLQISHCLIKVYRNHGAERKTAIDCKQMKKKIEKVRQQICNQENASRAKAKRDQQKRRKISSEVFASQTELPADHALAMELERLEVVASGPRIATAFYLRGEPKDYSDRCTITPKEGPNDFLKSSTDQSMNTLDFLPMQRDNASEATRPNLFTRKLVTSTKLPITPQPDEWSPLERSLGMASPISNPRLGLTPSLSPIQSVQESKYPVKPVKWIKVIDVDASYQCPEHLPPTAVLCLFVRVFHPCGDCTTEDYYRAAYLKQCTARELIDCVADRCDFQTASSKIIGVFHVSAVGKVIMVDDEFVAGIANEQDMSVELIQVKAEDLKQSPRIDDCADKMDILVEPDKNAVECLNKWHMKLRY